MTDNTTQDPDRTAETDGSATAETIRESEENSMSDENKRDSTESSREVATDGGMSDVEREKQIEYLDVEINLLKPATPFMRDHLRVIWIGFAVWVLTTFGPITATRLAPGVMTSQMPVISFPLHYFLIAIGGPSAALILSVWYARKRDQIDEKYGIEQEIPEPEPTDTVPDDAAATDGGVDE